MLQRLVNHLSPAARRWGRYKLLTWTGMLRESRGSRRGRELFSDNGTPPSPQPSGTSGHDPVAEPRNPFLDYFDAHRDGPGIWKWRHYFEIYQRHFQKFVGREVNVLEIGVYSGGSLGMWKHCFGPGCRVYGVDIEPACKSYESDSVKIFIGDQADRQFWRTLRNQAPPMDIIIDDGGHVPQQQIVTLEETLPCLRPGGVFLCEDVHGIPHKFTQYVSGLAGNLNATRDWTSELDNPERRIHSTATPFQAAVHSIHLYPYAVVIERTDAPVREFVCPKHGTHWEPFL